MSRAMTAVAIAAAFALASCTDARAPMGPESGPQVPALDGPSSVSMSIGFGSHTTGFNDDRNRFDLNPPSDVVEGDFLLAQITFEKGSALAVTAPGDWVLVRRTDRSSDIGQAIYYKIATDDEPGSYRWQLGESADAVGGILRYTGVDVEDPIVASSGNDGDGTRLTALGVDAEDGSKLIAFFGMSEEADFSTPAGMTRRYQVDNNDWDAMAADQDVDVGPTGNRVSDADEGDDKWVAQLVALRMAADEPDEPAETSTTLTVVPEETSEFGETITLTAHVTTNPDVTDGEVTFQRGGESCEDTDATDIATEGLDEEGKASTSVSDLDVGEYVFRACYLGTDDFQASDSDDVEHEVVKALTTTVLTVDPEHEATFGDPVTLTATVTRDHDGAEVDEGSVTFLYGGEDCEDSNATEIATEDLDENGKAETSTSELASGEYVFRACYGGSDSYEPSDDDLEYEILPLYLVTITSASGGSTTDFNAQAINWNITFTATRDGEALGCEDVSAVEVDAHFETPQQAVHAATQVDCAGGEWSAQIANTYRGSTHSPPGPPEWTTSSGTLRFTFDGVLDANDPTIPFESS